MHIIAVCCVALMIAALIVITRPETRAGLREVKPRVVQGVAVEQRDVRRTTRIAGKLQPARRVSLRFEVAGRVKQRYVQPGQAVITGQLLLEVDNGDYVDVVSESTALLVQERSAIGRDRRLLALEREEAVLLERELERLERLGRESLASKSRYDEAQQRLLRQQAEVARLEHSVDTALSRQSQREAALKRAERDLQRTRLLAPFDAHVNRIMLEVGEYVAAGQHAIDLIGLGELDVYLEAPGDITAALSFNQTLDLTVGERMLQGRIVALAFDPDPATNTHALRIRVDGSGLYPGQTALVALPGQVYRQAKMIPVSAILNEFGESFVFVIEGRRLRKQPVRVIARQGDLQLIDGLDAGVVVLAGDVSAYADGQAVIRRE